MNFLISFCLNNRITVILLTIALAVISIFVVKNIPVDVFPELKVPRVTIQTEAPGLTAEEVEQYITIPIESAMNGTAGVKGVRSSSGSGLSFVWVDFDWDKDIYQARQIVTERLGAVRESLPEGTSPELAPIVSVTGEIMLIALTGDKDTSTLDMRQARSMFSTVISNATHMSKTETDGLMDNYEFKNQEANAMIGLSKEFINTYLNTGRKLPLGGREKSNASLIKKVVPAGTLKYPVRVGKDKNGKSICEAKEVHVESYDAVKSYSPCPAWIKKKNK